MVRYAIVLLAGIIGFMVFIVHTDKALSQEAVSPKTLLSQKCAMCHGLGKIQNSLGRKDRAQWQDTIQRMRSKGAKLTDREQNTLAGYLGGLRAGDTF